MQLLVHAQELHTLKVTGQEMVTQIKAPVASPEGIAPEAQVVLLAGTPLEDEATLGRCEVEALITLAVASHMLGGEVHGSLSHAGRVRGQTPKAAKQDKQKETNQARQWMCTTGALSMLLPTFGEKKGPSANSKIHCSPGFPPDKHIPG
ncbi:ubiquitin-like protein FUBI [Mustela lutreola]|uniref:ubiquitin-like protein FUBI n=1 Tax=Mustela lutreola TaxID=9666 RepID=UPI0027975CD7|nr:ubiquitin-like protein FUBI [Mustela lutreola]